MMPDFPHNISIRLARLKKMLLCLCPVGCLSLAETANRAETEQRQDAKKNNRANLILILFFGSLQKRLYLGYNLDLSLDTEMSIILVNSARLCKPCNIFVLERIGSLGLHIHTMVYTPVHILWYIYPLTHTHMWFHM